MDEIRNPLFPGAGSPPTGNGTRETAREKTREKTGEKVLGLLRKDRTLTTAGLAERLGITDQGVEWQLKRLRQDGLLQRVGPDKGGHWEVREAGTPHGAGRKRAFQGGYKMQPDVCSGGGEISRLIHGRASGDRLVL